MRGLGFGAERPRGRLNAAPSEATRLCRIEQAVSGLSLEEGELTLLEFLESREGLRQLGVRLERREARVESLAEPRVYGAEGHMHGDHRHADDVGENRLADGVFGR